MSHLVSPEFKTTTVKILWVIYSISSSNEHIKCCASRKQHQCNVVANLVVIKYSKNNFKYTDIVKYKGDTRTMYREWSYLKKDRKKIKENFIEMKDV